MKYFFFNGCIPKDKEAFDYSKALSVLVIGYRTLKKTLGELPPIISVDVPNGITLKDGYPLSECIKDLKDHDLKNLAFSIFSHSPSYRFFDEDTFAEDVVANKYALTIEGHDYDGTNIAIAKFNDSFLFTLGVCDDLKSDRLCVNSLVADRSFRIENFHGEEANVRFIESLFNNARDEELSLMEKIGKLLQGCVWTTRFAKDFRNLPHKQQQSVLESFEYAEKLGILKPIMPDNVLIKDVSNEHSNKRSRLYELRIGSPVAMRVYFTVVDGGTRLLLIGRKSSGQSEDIKIAHGMLETRS